jgi:oligosaccharide repeat unit polymerase
MASHHDELFDELPEKERLPLASFAFPLILISLSLTLLAELVGNNGRMAITIQVSVYSISVFTLLALIGIRRQYINDLGMLFIVFSHAFWFALPAFSQLLIPGHWYGDWIGMFIPDESLSKAAILIQLFLLMNAIGYFVFRGRVQPTIPPSDRSLVSGNQRIFLISLLLLIGLLPYIIYGGSFRQVVSGILLGRADKAWASSAGSLIDADGVMTIFWLTRSFLLAAVTLSGVYLLVQKRHRLIVNCFYLFVAGLGVLILYYDQGTRSYLALAVVPVTTLWILRGSFANVRFRPGRLILLGVSTGLLLLAIGQFQVAYRSEWTRDKMSAQTFGEIVNPQHHVDFFTETANAVTVLDERLTAPLYQSALFYFAVNPIPRIFWHDKPIDRTLWYFSLYRWGADISVIGGNALPSIVGQYYINFGTPGVIWIGFLFGFITAIVERVFHRAADRVEFMVAAVSAFTLMFLSFRHFAPGFHYATILLFLIVFIYNKRSPYPEQEYLVD